MSFKSAQTQLPNDPLEVFERLVGQHENCFLLETLADEHQPQTTSQSYIGLDPEKVFTAQSGELLVNGEPQPAENAYRQLQKELPRESGLPDGYVGGLVGFFSHEGVHHLEPSLNFEYERQFPDFSFGYYQDGLIFSKNGSPSYFHSTENRQPLYESTALSEKKGLTISYLGQEKNQTDYERMIETAREDIMNGRVFQVVLANRFSYGYEGELIELYKELRQINPSAFMFFIKFGDTVTFGASPELLDRTTPDGKVYLEALAGTIRRGVDATEDEALAQELLADEKEIAEHNMMVDLARNDVGRVSKIGSVQIDDLMYVKKLSHVQHLSSIVSGTLDDKLTAFDALAASFPAGTLSGAPKIEGIKMIHELEGYERGPYGGTIGYFSRNGDSVHAVNIRSVNAVKDRLYVHSGSGIVYDSNPTKEYQEIKDKKAAVDRSMSSFLREVS